MSKQSVLFLCAHNAARSQMAEALLRKHAGDRFEVVSAGLEPTAVHPLTLRVLNEVGVDVASHRAKGLGGLMGKKTFQLAIICAIGRRRIARTFSLSRCNASIGRLKTRRRRRARKRNSCRSSATSATKSRCGFWNG